MPYFHIWYKYLVFQKSWVLPLIPFWVRSFFALSSLKNLVLLGLEKGTSIPRPNLQNQGLLSFLVFSMSFCRYCYSIYEPISHINQSKQPCVLQQAYHILDMQTKPSGSSMGSLSPLLFCKFLNNWDKL